MLSHLWVLVAVILACDRVCSDFLPLMMPSTWAPQVHLLHEMTPFARCITTAFVWRAGTDMDAAYKSFSSMVPALLLRSCCGCISAGVLLDVYWTDVSVYSLRRAACILCAFLWLAPTLPPLQHAKCPPKQEEPKTEPAARDDTMGDLFLDYCICEYLLGCLRKSALDVRHR
jgi:hypothetical protein